MQSSSEVGFELPLLGERNPVECQARGRMYPLIIECCRSHPDLNEVRRLALSCTDWDRVVASALDARVAPLVFWTLRKACPDAVPPENAAHLRSAFKEQTKRTLLLTTELIRLLDLFDRAGIQVIPLKGPALAWSLYESPGLRSMSDLDLLVGKSDARRARDLLVAGGYCRWVPKGVDLHLSSDSGEMPLLRADGSVGVDLHWRISAAHFDTLGASGFWSRLSSVDIAGRRTPAFEPEDLLLFLCLHGAKHCWERLFWLCDLVRLIDDHDLDWDEILARAERLGMLRIVLLGLSLARGLLGADVPANLLNRAQADRDMPSLVSLVRSAIETGESVSSTYLRWRLAEGAQRKLRLLRCVLFPTAADWELLDLSKWSFPLYCFATPLYLARAAVRRGLLPLRRP